MSKIKPQPTRHGTGRPAGQVKAINPGEAALLVKACDKRSTRGKRDGALLRLLWDLGARPIEICWLSVKDFQGDCVTLRRAKKRGKVVYATLPIAPTTTQALQTHLRSLYPTGAPQDAALFQTLGNGRYHGERITSEVVNCIVQRAAERADLSGWISASSFRRGKATSALRSDALNVRDIQTLLGHANLQTTQAYLDSSPERLRQAVTVLAI